MPVTSQGQILVGELILYTYFRSSCSCRIRTACRLKGIPFTCRYINLLQDEQHSSEYISKVNPNAVVPTLVVTAPNGEKIVTITQSIAILEFLEEAFPSVPLLPKETLARARVRELVNIIACDIQPPTNLRILKRVNGLGVTNKEWFEGCMQRPLAAYENILERTARKYSFGDEITLADVCLAPAIENATRWGVDMAGFPRTTKVFDALNTIEAFRDGHWSRQDDAPEGLRVRD